MRSSLFIVTVHSFNDNQDCIGNGKKNAFLMNSKQKQSLKDPLHAQAAYPAASTKQDCSGKTERVWDVEVT